MVLLGARRLFEITVLGGNTRRLGGITRRLGGIMRNTFLAYLDNTETLMCFKGLDLFQYPKP